MRSFVATPKTVTRRWHVIDAEGQVLGRVATRAARLLQGKHKATYTPFLDTGDHVVIVNAAKVKLTGRKEEQKLYRRHSGYLGGLKEERAGRVRVVVVRAVKRGSPAAEVGIAPGDVIREVNSTEVGGMAEFRRLSARAHRSGELVLLVQRGYILERVAFDLD